MIFNYLKITFRNIVKRRSYSFIQIGGLAVGLTAAGLVILYLQHELSFDRFHPSADNTYRIVDQQDSEWFAFLSRPYSDALYEGQLSTIQKIARVRKFPPRYMQYGDKKFYQERVLFSDPGTKFFEVFNFPFVYGNPATALSMPNSVVVTSRVASKYFQNKNPLGETLRFDTLQLTVTGVMEDLPSNTHFDFDVLITDKRSMDAASGIFTYCVLPQGTDIASVENSIIRLPVATTQFNKATKVRLQPLTNLHFDANLTFEMKPPGSSAYMIVFCFIGLAILLISLINYINLSVAIYATRTKELAVRKVAGATVSGLTLQFITEAMFTVFISMYFTIVLVQVLLPSFNALMNVNLTNKFISSLSFFSVLLGVTLLAGLVSGIYPTLVLSRSQPQALFKKIGVVSRQGLSLRGILLTGQFAVMISMVSLVWFINQQMDYISSKDLGFKKEGVLKINRAWNVDSTHYRIVKHELLTNPHILSVSEGLVPGDEDYGNSYHAEGASEVYKDALMTVTDYDYIKVLGIQPLSGNIFSIKENERPLKALLINEALASRLGYQDPIGKSIVIHPGTKYERKNIIDGVFRNYHYFSLHEAVVPQMIIINRDSRQVYENILLKIDGKNIKETLASVQQVIDKVIPDIPVGLEFLDESLKKFYQQEERMAIATSVLMVISVILAFAGLTALASYMTELKTKEIGVRKVLGAAVWDIHRLFLKTFGKVILWAFPLGTLASFIAIEKWLQLFAYHTEINVLVFGMTGALVFLGVTLIVAAQVNGVARTNPVESLRSE